jgi:SGNH hydrolase-like domain, acetyltransferase AlgX
MNKTKYIIFIGFFLALIYAVPMTQAIAERLKNTRIQALDIAEDALITPYRNARKIHDLALRQTLYIDSLIKDINALPDSASAHAQQVVDEALAGLGDLKKTSFTVNRHVRVDSTSGQFRPYDTISAHWSAALLLLRQGGRAADCKGEAARIRGEAREILWKCPMPSIFDVPVMCVKNLRHIFWNDKYLRPFEKELENSSVFASACRPRMQYVRYVLFKDLGEKGVLGQSGWFFYKLDVDFLIKPYVRDPRSIAVDPNDKPMNDNPVLAIARFKQQLAERGIGLLVVIVPGKPSIYPDCVSRKLRPEQAGTFSHSLRMIDDLEKQGIDVVDLFGPFAKERLQDKNAGDSMYLRSDTHWRARGVRLAAKVVAQRIKTYPWYRQGESEFAIDSVFVDRTGDVAVMTTLPLDKMRARSVSFAPEKTKCYQVYRIARDEAGNQTGRTLYKDDFKNSPILLLGDSFSRIYQTDEPRGAGWIAHLALELSRPIASVVNDGGASTLVRYSLARRPNLLKGRKLVVWEIVERDFRYGDEGWKDVPLAAKQD